MAVVQFQYQNDYEDLVCGECGIVFYVPAYWKSKRVNERGSFSCPNGHGRRFIGETEAEKIKRKLTAQLEAERRQNEWLNVRISQQKKTLAAVRGSATKLKKHIRHGVCPCCHRTFKQLSAHMATKHPDYVASSTAPEPPAAEGETD